MSDESPVLETKLSPLIEGQVPDFIQADYPVYVQFLKSYYKFMESGELKVTVTVESILAEQNTTTYILEETNGEKIVLEEGSGSTGKFVNNEIITGQTSKATATVHVEDTSNGRLFISAQQLFITGETIVGGTSGAQGIVTSYRGNPVQNIQQLMEYAKPDNTIDDMLENFRRMFMNVIPSTLADGVSKRNLVKAIRDLYTAKGTSEGHKFFLRMLLDDDAEIIYPEKFMMRLSDGNWNAPKLIRTTIPVNTTTSDFVGQKITSAALETAIIVSGTTFVENGVSFAEYELDPNSVTGTFSIDEPLEAVSALNDHLYTFNVKGIISGSSVSSGGILHTEGEIITTDSSIGNGLVELEVNNIGVGSVSDIIIDDEGSGYAVGDALVFTAAGQSNTATAVGKVSVVGGMLRLEDGTASNSGTDGGQILFENNIASIHEPTEIVLDGADINSSHAGDNLIQEAGDVDGTGDALLFESSLDFIYTPEDLINPATDGIILDTDNSNRGIRKIDFSTGGAGYSALPVITVTSSGGSSAKLLATTDDIGSVEEIKIKNAGFGYSSAPDPIFRIHLIIKDITGTFSAGASLVFNAYDAASATVGTVVSHNTDTNVLTITPTISPNSKIVLEDNNDILLENDGGSLISDESFFSGETSVISTSAATATIVKSNVAEGTLTNSTTLTKSGFYDDLEFLSTLGEDTVRIQDSYYYQQFSYEIDVGASLSQYLNELRRAVHPTGFLPFGKVTIASQIAAGISILTGKDIPDYTGDTDTFTPELASTFKLVFDDYLITRRLGTINNMDRFIVLNGTDGSSTNAGDNVLAEDILSNDLLVYEDGTFLNTTPMDVIEADSNNQVSSEENLRELTITKDVHLTLSQEPVNRSNPNGLKLLTQFPFHNPLGAIELETATLEDQAFSAYWDSTLIKFDKTTTPKFDVGADTTYGRVILDGSVTQLGATVNGVSIAQSILSINDLVGLEVSSDTGDGSNFKLSVVGDIRFDELYQYHVIRQEAGTTTNINDEAESISLEDGHDILLEDGEQLTSRLPFSDTIWDHSKEKHFTLPSVIHVT